jgi:hypothetical protein
MPLVALVPVGIQEEEQVDPTPPPTLARVYREVGVHVEVPTRFGDVEAATFENWPCFVHQHCRQRAI